MMPEHTHTHTHTWGTVQRSPETILRIMFLTSLKCGRPDFLFVAFYKHTHTHDTICVFA